MTASFGATIAFAVWLDLGGLPALPLLSLAFLLANADLLWREVRRSLRRSDAQNAAQRPSRAARSAPLGPRGRSYARGSTSATIVQVLPSVAVGRLHVLVPDAYPAAGARGRAHRSGARAVGVRADLRGVVGPRRRRGRKNDVSSAERYVQRSPTSGRDLFLGSRPPEQVAVREEEREREQGSAGRPPRSSHTARAIVTPKDAVISSQVTPVRNPKRSVAARKSAKKRRSGIPRFADPFSPGTGKANERRSKTPGGRGRSCSSARARPSTRRPTG